MKSDVHPGVIAAVGVVLVVIIGFVAYKVFGGDPTKSSATPAQVSQVKQMRAAIMTQGVHRDVNGHFVDAQGNPVDVIPTRR